MPTLPKAARALVVACAATVMLIAPTPTALASPGITGNGGADGGCSSGPNWHGCGGWNPIQGGFGSGCVNGICGGWDGSRAWVE